MCLKCNKIGDEDTIFKSALDSNNSRLVDSLVKQGAKLGYGSKEKILNEAIEKGYSDTVEVLLENNYPFTYSSLKYALESNSFRIVRLLINLGALDMIYAIKKEKMAFIPSLIEYLSDSYDRKKYFKVLFSELNYKYMKELLIYLIENPNRSDVRESVIDLFCDYSEIIDCICKESDGVYDLDRQIKVFVTCEQVINKLIKIKTDTATCILDLFIKHREDLNLCTVALDGFGMKYEILSLSPLKKNAKDELNIRGNAQHDPFILNSQEAWMIKIS